MDEMLFYFCFLFIMLVIIMALVAARRNAANAARQRQAQTTQTNTQRQQLVEDIKATKTGRVVDQISIIEELSVEASIVFRLSWHAAKGESSSSCICA